MLLLPLRASPASERPPPGSGCTCLAAAALARPLDGRLDAFSLADWLLTLGGRLRCSPSQVCKTLLIGPEDKHVAFQHAKVPQWTSTIVENVLKELAVDNSEAAKNGAQKFKFVVTTHLQQKVGAAFVTAAATYGDKNLDSNVCVKWESDAVQVVVTVFGMAI